MRATVTLTPEVERLTKDAMRQTGESLKSVLNQAIVRGLAISSMIPDEEPFVVDSTPIGLPVGRDPARLNGVTDDLEADSIVALTNFLLAKESNRQ